MKPTLRIGARILVKNSHWLRANEFGTIVEYEHRRNRNNCWLVAFDESRTGAGIAGTFLWLSEDDFTEVKGAEQEGAQIK